MPDDQSILLIKELVKNVTTVAPEQFDNQQTAEAEFLEYNILRSKDEAALTEEDTRKKTELRKKVISMMNLDTVTAGKLDDYGEERSELYTQNNLLQEDADRSGLNKVAKDFFGRKKSAAKKKIARNYKIQDTIQKMHLQKEVDERLEDDERSYKVNEVAGERMEQGKNSGAFLQRLGNRLLIGEHGARRKEYPIPKYDDTISEEIDIQTKDGVLKGVLHKPMKSTGKVVVYYSGNTASTMSQSKDSAKAHLNNGARVLCVDYRGFGKSITTDKNGEKVGTYMLEDGMYRDSMEIYNYAKNNLVKNTSDIILHGYSLGGSMASRVAAQVSLDNANTLRGKKVSENDRLGGMILQSPINSAYDAARLTASTPEKFRNNDTGWFANLQAKILKNASGTFSTEDHMKTVAKYDPYLPVLFLSGSSEVQSTLQEKTISGDFLSLEDTKIDKLSGMKNTATFIGNHRHVPSEMNFNDKHNATRSNEKLEELLKFGRSTDLSIDNKNKPVPIKGLESNGKYKHSFEDSRTFIREHSNKHNNTLIKSAVNSQFADFCVEYKDAVISESISSLDFPEKTTPDELKKMLMESNSYATAVCTMTAIGKQMMKDNPPLLGDNALLSRLNEPLVKDEVTDEGVVVHGSKNLENVKELLGELEKKSFGYFMQNEEIKEMYDKMQMHLDTVPFFKNQPNMMGQALALLFADLSLAYIDSFSEGKSKEEEKDNDKINFIDKTAFGLLSHNKSIVTSNRNISYFTNQFQDYLTTKDIEAINGSITSNTSRIITQDIQTNEKKEK